jgi:Tfp pilus assembly protein PilX
MREESGMTLALTMLMIVLIGVMGAGLLTFVTTDLREVAQSNRGQQALQIADAGVEAAKQQLIADSAATTSYDGGTDDRPWSYCYNIPACSNFSPTATGSDGMTLNMDAGSASVTILLTSYSPATYRVISEGRAGEARRKVESYIRSDADITFPRTYVTRTNLSMSGSINPVGVSFFALGNATLTNNVNLGNQPDRYYGKWAETTGTGPYPNSVGSYPNESNLTARSTDLAGVAAWGTVCSGTHTTQTRGARVLAGAGTSTCSAGTGTATNPAVVPDYYTSGLAPSAKIAFPFQAPTEAQDKQELDVLRQRALSQETSSNPLYIDSSPGNKINDAGMPNRPNGSSLDITTWPSGSNYDTVRFYEFQSYSANNVVRYVNGSSEAACDDIPPHPKGVIAVENGDFVYDGNRLFNGGIIVRAYNASGVSIPTQGKFTASGTPCFRGYANSGGTMSIAGTIALGDVPELASLATFQGGMQQISWRELYQ